MNISALKIMGILRECGYPVQRGGTQSYGQRPDLYGLDGVHLEIKRSERAQIWDWMEQSQRDAQRFRDGMPTVVFRRSRSKWLICMELTDFLTIYQAAENANKKQNSHSI